MARLPVGEVRPCAACQKTIIGALTVNGKVAPIEVEPHDDGNIWLGKSRPVYAIEREDGGTSYLDSDTAQPQLGQEPPEAIRVFRAATLAGEHLAWARRQGLALHHNHFATCPHKDRFRSGGTPS